MEDKLKHLAEGAFTALEATSLPSKATDDRKENIFSRSTIAPQI
jgi:hypothetical protein